MILISPKPSLLLVLTAWFTETPHFKCHETIQTQVTACGSSTKGLFTRLIQGHTACLNFQAGKVTAVFTLLQSAENSVIRQAWSGSVCTGPVSLLRKWMKRQDWQERGRWQWSHPASEAFLAHQGTFPLPGHRKITIADSHRDDFAMLGEVTHGFAMLVLRIPWSPRFYSPSLGLPILARPPCHTWGCRAISLRFAIDLRPKVWSPGLTPPCCCAACAARAATRSQLATAAACRERFDPLRRNTKVIYKLNGISSMFPFLHCLQSCFCWAILVQSDLCEEKCARKKYWRNLQKKRQKSQELKQAPGSSRWLWELNSSPIEI